MTRGKKKATTQLAVWPSLLSAKTGRKHWNRQCVKRGKRIGILFFSFPYFLCPELSTGGKTKWLLRRLPSYTILWLPPLRLLQGAPWKASPVAKAVHPHKHAFPISSPGPSDTVSRSAGNPRGFMRLPPDTNSMATACHSPEKENADTK